MSRSTGREDRLSGRNVLITGGAGFIGAHVAHRLVTEGAGVSVLVRGSTDRARLADVGDRVTVFEADVRDPGATRDVLARAGELDYVLHLAGDASERKAGIHASRWNEAVTSRVGATFSLLAAIAGTQTAAHLVRIGSMEEYGDGPIPFEESQRERAVSGYSAALIAATHAAHSFGALTGIAVTTLRSGVVYGPGQSTDFLIPELLAACRSGQDFAMTAGEQTADFVYVDDVVDAFLQVMRVDHVSGHIINVGSGSEVTIREVAETVVRVTGADITLRTGAVADRAGESSRRVLSVEKAERLLGWRAGTALEAGIARIWATS